MKNFPVISKLIATVTIVSLLLVVSPATAAVQTGSIAGTVFSVGAEAPMSGARVHVGDPATGEVYHSDWTGEDGSFSLTGLPPAEYQVAVESDGALYVVNSVLKLAPGESHTVQVGVNRDEAAPPPSEEEDDDDDDGGLALWDNPGTAALLVLTGAAFLGWLIEQFDSDPRESF